MSLTAGSMLGTYQLERLIGSGGFSTVWRARDNRFDSSVAIKVLAENHALNPDARSRFVDEARMIRKVRSDQIVAVHDIGETASGQPYLVLALADRGDLTDRLTERAPGGVAPTDALEVVNFLVEALSDVHAAGLVHRDVKPGNILLAERVRADHSQCRLIDDDERLLLADLGFAKDLSLASGYTVGGGTRWFQAPEQLPSVAVVDRRADIYAASALVAWLLTGSVPNPHSSWLEHLGERGRVHGLAAGLAQKPDDRPPSMEAWGEQLRAVLGGSDPAIRRLSRRRLLAGGGGLILASSAAAGGWFFGNSTADPDRNIVIAGNTVRIQTTTSAGPLQVTGPSAMRVGEPAFFRAVGPTGALLSWVQPDGQRLDATLPLELVASSTGIAVINLEAVVEGRVVVITHDIDVTDGN